MSAPEPAAEPDALPINAAAEVAAELRAARALAGPPPAEAPFDKRLVQLAQDADLPRLVVEPFYDRGRKRWLLYPWWACRDIGALVAWADLMADPVLVSVTQLLPDVVEVRILGSLAGEMAELVGSTHRMPASAVDFPLDLDALRPVVELERCIVEGLQAPPRARRRPPAPAPTPRPPAAPTPVSLFEEPPAPPTAPLPAVVVAPDGPWPHDLLHPVVTS